MKLAKCPYCGRRLSYMSAFMYKTKGEYECGRCKKKSNVSINKKIWLVFSLVMLVAVIIMILAILYLARDNVWPFILVMIPFFIFYFFVPFFVNLRPLKKYREFVSQQQKYEGRPEIIAPISESEYNNGPMIDTDVFNKIKAKRKIITEEESARTKAFKESNDFNNVETDTISCDLLKEKTAAFTFKDREITFEKEESQEDNFLDDLFSNN